MKNAGLPTSVVKPTITLNILLLLLLNQFVKDTTGKLVKHRHLLMCNI